MTIIAMKSETPRYNIDTCAMLVEFSAPVWTARKLDKKVSAEVVASKDAKSTHAARVNKHLLAGRQELDRINAHINWARGHIFYPCTLPWSDSGLRLLPAAAFSSFDAKMAEAGEHFWNLCREFIDVYPHLITAQAMALGDMFDRADYPDPKTIAHKFDWRVTYMPVPSAGDFRIDVGNAARTELEEKLQRVTEERVEHAMNELRANMRDVLQRMSQGLGTKVDDKGEIKGNRFAFTMIEAGLRMCDMAKILNVTGDVRVEQARQGLERILSGINAHREEPEAVAETLRENFTLRENTKARVDALLDKFSI